ncbi:MAG: glycosyl hydrolase, partial [Saprospiraceae bacterium]|nr:glycosyl hydrolase [Saprospiraceae bacterium]
GGVSWQKISGESSGFPTGENTGRIGLAAGRKNGKTILYACLDNQNSKPDKKEDKTSDALTKDQLRTMSKADFLQLSDEKLDDFLKKNEFPEKYKSKQVKQLVEKGKIMPIALVEYLEDANNQLFETDYIGAELYRSEDGGATWRRTHEEAIEQMHFTYGYYFSNVRCMPEDADQVYLIGFLIIRSEDGGKTWKNINGDNVHVDHHALWLNAARPGHLINGNDGGINISWDNGQSWTKCNTPPVGQFYAVSVDQAEPYNVYGGAQDNGVWVGPSQYEASAGWQQTGQYPYRELMGGDGMQVQVDYRDNATVYTGFQFGNYFRINRHSGNTTTITPKHDLGERPLRFNWQTPIHLSRHQQDVLYLGANKVYRSFNKGDDWEAISGDLTQGGKKGNVPYGTLTSIHESPLKFGLLYAGSDDGLVHVTRDGGENWTNISAGLPQNMWVSRVQASAHERSRAYVSLSGYRKDDFSAYLFVSENYGQSWQPIGLDLPSEPINVVREDPSNPNVLYVGTDHNLYVSLDRGQHFQTLSAEFPEVPVHDLVIQAKTSDLVVGTHGRSAFKVNVSKLQQLNDETLAKALFVYDLKKEKHRKSWGKKQPYEKVKDPEYVIEWYAAKPGKTAWSVKTKDGKLTLQSGSTDSKAGLNKLVYGLDVSEGMVKKYQDALQSAQKDTKKPLTLEKADTGKVYLQAGTYQVVIEKDGVTETKELVIE